MNTTAEARTFYRGESVKKVGGYKWPGVILATFDTLAGEPRVVVECTVPEVAGALHIFNTNQIERLGASLELAPDPRALSVPWDSEAIVDVLAERRRQVEVEGWTPEHDDQHANGEMAGAAACYALYRSQVPAHYVLANDMLADIWPWPSDCFKIKDRRHDLVRAAALMIAEIERLDRAEASASDGARS